MAAFNKVVLVGRLTRDCETKTFASGGMVAKFGFAVTNRKKNGQTGQWEDEPMFIDCEAFNRGEFGKLADVVQNYCKKGSQILVEGKLKLEQWDDKATGQKRSRHKIDVDNIQLLDPKPTGDGEAEAPAAPPPAKAAAAGSKGAAKGRARQSVPDDSGDGDHGGDVPF